MGKYSNEFLAAIGNNGRLFAPAWSYLKEDGKPDGRHDQTNMRWRAGVPSPQQGEKWTGGCYIGTVIIAISSTQAGAPTVDPNSTLGLRLCSGVGTVTTTDQRIFGILKSGDLLGTKINGDTSKLVFSLSYRDALNAEPVIERKTFGGSRLLGVRINVRGANEGAVQVIPERGYNSPWDPEKRSIWGKGVADSIWQDVVKVATGSEHPGMLSPIAFASAGEQAATMSAVSDVIMLIRAVGANDAAARATGEGAIRALPIVDVVDGIGTFGNMIAEQMTPEKKQRILSELASSSTDRRAAVQSLGEALLDKVDPQQVLLLMDQQLGDVSQDEQSNVMIEIIRAAGRALPDLNVQFQEE